MEFKQLFEIVRSALPTYREVYLVGGAVRDILLGKEVHDLDFAIAGDTRKVAQAVARKLQSPYFILDDHRLTARVIYHGPEGEDYQLDFAALVQNDLETDLRQRDFTVNAIAIEASRPDITIDPCEGQQDLATGLLRSCSPMAMLNDPLRVLRGVRLSLNLGLTILPETETLMLKAAPELVRVSPERKRDELMRILEVGQPADAILLLDQLKVVACLLPELEALKGARQTAPHVFNVWDHTLDTLRQLQAILDLLFNSTEASTPRLVQAASSLQPFLEPIRSHLSTRLVPGRSMRSLLTFEALYHDIAKPLVMTTDEAGNVQHHGHAELGARLVADRARALMLSNVEIDHIQRVVAHHMRLHFLAQNNSFPTRRAIYRFFKAAGEAGIDICLISLADTLATYGSDLPEERWKNELAVCQGLLEAWWEKPAESIRPDPLLNGNDLKTQLGLEPGPLLGQIIEHLHEAQAAGEITTREEAYAIARNFLSFRGAKGNKNDRTRKPD